MMLEDAKRAYYRSRDIRKKFIIISLVMCTLVITFGILLSAVTKNTEFVPLSVVFGGIGSYLFYYTKTGGYKFLYGQYFEALKSDLAVNENIHINDHARYSTTEHEIKAVFEDFTSSRVNLGLFIQVQVDDVVMSIMHAKAYSPQSEQMKPDFDGTILVIKGNFSSEFSYNQSTNGLYLENPTYLKIVREALGEDVRIVQTKDMLYIATTETIKINHYINEFHRTGFYNPVVHYDDLDKVIDSWRYYKVLKNILVN